LYYDGLIAATVLSTTVFVTKVTSEIGKGWMTIRTFYRNSQQKFEWQRYDISTVNYQGREYWEKTTQYPKATIRVTNIN